MMDKATRTKVRAHYKALEGMRTVLESNAKVNSSVIGPGIPEQIADEMKRLNGDVPSLGRPLDLRSFVSHNVGRGGDGASARGITERASDRHHETGASACLRES